MINKKTLLIVSGIFTLVLIALNQIGTDTLCGLIQQDTVCMGNLYSGMMNLFPIIPLFLFSLITYFMRDDVYRVWLHFACVWIPISMALIFLAPEYASSFIYPITKGSIAFISSLLFAVISLVLIIWKYFVARKNKIG